MKKLPLLYASLLFIVTFVLYADGEVVSFNRHIRPILSDACYACHGPDANQRKANLRLDTKEGAFTELGGYYAITPGDPSSSKLIWRITHPDTEQRMPPPDSNRRYPSQAEIELIKKWIEQGAKWEEHWIYTPPQRSALPEVIYKEWPLTPIDYFILARLETERLKPSPQVDQRTLIRRLSFDLTGLPPNPQEVDSFLTDRSPNAYEKVVDRLLASPRYGERMAMYWLDLVRYADTTGYHSDEDISIWPYRDYVIKAFNNNMRYDQFTRENLAGDLLPNATTDQKVASGYNRLNQTTAEGGAQAKEYLAMYAADRVRTTASVWLAATVGCAQCHDHKFDPYTTEDFYSLAAFFADIQEVGVYGGNSKRDPIVLLPTKEQESALRKIENTLFQLQKELNAPNPQIQEGQLKWEKETLSMLDSSDPVDFAWIDDAQNNGGKIEGEWKFINKNEGPVFSQQFSRRQQAKKETTIQHFFHGANRKITLSKSDTLFAYVWIDKENPPLTIMLQWNDGSWDHRAFWGQDKIGFGEIGTDTNAHRFIGKLPQSGQWIRLEVDLTSVGLKPGSEINGMSFAQYGGTAFWDLAGVRTTRDSQLRSLHPKEVLAVLPVKHIIRTADQQETVSKHYRAITPLLDETRDKISSLKKEKSEIEKDIPYSLTTVSVNPRTMRILPRGNWMDDSGEIVTPNTPTFLKNIGSEDQPATRLDLADWVVSPDNPMTARAFVNRLWYLFFGTGISKVLDDLGSQGEPPKHPKLLDWLAVEFMETGWNVRKMVKLMVMSNTYRQSSKSTHELIERDPYNRLLAHQSRFRLDAEMVRDNALFVSGLLIPRIGGKSVKPYQPQGYYANLNFPKRVYKHDRGESQYRRGLYTHWQRTFLHPSMMAFDAPSRQECTAERPNSNTPLQALTLLNDPSYVETARVLAERIIKEGGETVTDRINWCYRLVLSRMPNPKELVILMELYNKHHEQYKNNLVRAKKLVNSGEWPTAEDADLSELATWTSVARVMFNLHETITRY